MNNPEYCTVVFQITDREKAKIFLSPLVQGMGEEVGPAPGVRVTAVSMRDEITIVEALEAACPSRHVGVQL